MVAQVAPALRRPVASKPAPAGNQLAALVIRSIDGVEHVAVVEDYALKPGWLVMIGYRSAWSVNPATVRHAGGPAASQYAIPEGRISSVEELANVQITTAG